MIYNPGRGAHFMFRNHKVRKAKKNSRDRSWVEHNFETYLEHIYLLPPKKLRKN